jgi:multicomponent Na+:H+ antiporter subunit E
MLVIWVALWGELSVANVASGVIVIAIITALFPTRNATHRVHPVGVVRFGVRLMVDLVISSWNIVLAVVRPDADRIHAEVLDVTLSTRSRLVAAIVANSITLTPGTMTVDISDGGASGTDPFVLRVHVLGRIEPAVFTDEVLSLERRVLGAVSPISPASANARESAS